MRVNVGRMSSPETESRLAQMSKHTPHRQCRVPWSDSSHGNRVFVIPAQAEIQSR